MQADTFNVIRNLQWIYKLATLAPYGLNDNDGFYNQNKKSRAGARGRQKYLCP